MARRFTWDTKKNRANRRKHGISFETAVLVLDDPNAIGFQDRAVAGEQRWQIIGWAETAIILLAHTLTVEASDEVIRIISARKATPFERRAYEEELD